jgi:hypothetical protein
MNSKAKMIRRKKRGGFAERLLEKTTASDLKNALPTSEWNFDETKVSDTEVVACCLWEYARESATLKKLRQQCETACRADGNANSLVSIVAGNIRHSRNSVELYLREIVLQLPSDLWQSADESKPFYWPPDAAFPPLTSNFPNSWQSMSTDERARRAESVDLKIKPYFAFSRGRLRDAQAIVRTVMEQRKVALNPKIDPLTVSLIATSVPLMVDAPFEWTDDNDRLPGGFVYPGGTEVSVVEIDWAHFTDKEIADAIARSRPKEIPETSGRGRGDTIADWRAKLERLGIMRLMHRHSFDDLGKIVPGEWLNREKYSTKAECKNEHKKALDDFHDLLPLQSDEKPLSFEPLAGNW